MLRRLKALRAVLMDPLSRSHGGRIAKTAGDGLLIEFGSGVDALRCAVEIQAQMPQHSNGAPRRLSRGMTWCEGNRDD
jgi:adenylate cyclase